MAPDLVRLGELVHCTAGLHYSQHVVTTDSNDATLIVDFAGEVHELDPGDELTFGRGESNDLEIDSNPQLHRRFGHLSFRDGFWWLRNNGNRLALTLQDQNSRSSATLTSGREISLTFASATVAFEAGSTRYEVLLQLEASPVESTPSDFGTDDSLSHMTIDQSQVPLVGDQRLLAVALAESKLRNPHGAIDLPTNKAVAHRFGWSSTTFNRKLDRMCKKYARAGVSGLVGGPGGLASDRRTRLVEHLVSSGAISVADLDLLEEAAASSD